MAAEVLYVIGRQTDTNMGVQSCTRGACAMRSDKCRRGRAGVCIAERACHTLRRPVDGSGAWDVLVGDASLRQFLAGLPRSMCKQHAILRACPGSRAASRLCKRRCSMDALRPDEGIVNAAERMLPRDNHPNARVPPPFDRCCFLLSGPWRRGEMMLPLVARATTNPLNCRSRSRNLAATWTSRRRQSRVCLRAALLPTRGGRQSCGLCARA